MAILSKNTVMAVKTEVTEGVPVVPTASTDFIALQDDADMTVTIDTIDNNELRSSIGSAQSIQGLERAGYTFSHYLRHSGVEGTPPDYRKFLKGAFGTETVQGTEYPTVAASTTSVIKVNTGIGANFSRGQALLIKDGVNGYSIRPILSVSGDNITLAFNLSVAPAAGVMLGKAVTYSPADTGFETLSVWQYGGNGGVVEMVSGARVTGFTADITAGDAINATFTAEAIGYYFNPINITATDTKFDFEDDGGVKVATVAAKVYKDPHVLAGALQSAINAAAPTETVTVVYSNTTGKFTIATATNTTFSLLWNTGANTANSIGDKIGFSLAADSTGALTYTSATALVLSAPYSPTFDAAAPLVAKYNQVLFGTETDNSCFSSTNLNFSITNTRQEISDICAQTGISGSLITAREVTGSVTGLLTQYEAQNFERFRNGDTIRFAYNFGPKDSAANWIPGSCGQLFIASATIDTFDLTNDNGLIALKMDIKGYVDNLGRGEAYMNLV